MITEEIAKLFEYYIQQFEIGVMTYDEASKACCAAIDKLLQQEE